MVPSSVTRQRPTMPVAYPAVATSEAWVTLCRSFCSMVFCAPAGREFTQLVRAIREDGVTSGLSVSTAIFGLGTDISGLRLRGWGLCALAPFIGEQAGASSWTNELGESQSSSS